METKLGYVLQSPYDQRPDVFSAYEDKDEQFNDENLSFNNKIKKVKTFTEKPNQELALQFIDSGDFSWNSGIFIWKVKNILTYPMDLGL